MEGHIEFLLEIRRVVQDALEPALTDHREFNRKLDAPLDAQRRTEASVARLVNGQPYTGQTLPPLGSARARVAEAQAQTERALRDILESLE